jgi:hypothetical protein
MTATALATTDRALTTGDRYLELSETPAVHERSVLRQRGEAVDVHAER